MCGLGCGKKHGSGGGGSYTPKKGNFPKPIGTKKQSYSSRGGTSNGNQFGQPKIRMSFGRKS